MNKKVIAMMSVVIGLAVGAVKITVANESATPAASSAEGIKSVGYYVANAKEARDKNRECYEKGIDMQSEPNCANSLHALQISYVGGDKISANKFSRD